MQGEGDPQAGAEDGSRLAFSCTGMLGPEAACAHSCEAAQHGGSSVLPQVGVLQEHPANRLGWRPVFVWVLSQVCVGEGQGTTCPTPAA